MGRFTLFLDLLCPGRDSDEKNCMLGGKSLQQSIDFKDGR